MERVYLDCTGLPNSIPVRSELPNSIYVDASDLQRVLNSFLESLPNAIAEGLKANSIENRVMPKIAELIDDLIKDQDDLFIDTANSFDKIMYKYCKGRLEFLKKRLSTFTA